MIALSIALAFLGVLTHNVARTYVARRYPEAKPAEIAALEARVVDLAKAVESLSAERALARNAQARKPGGLWADGSAS